ENLTKSFAIYFVTQVLSIIVALMLAKLPIDILLGSVSGDLATLVITKNVILFNLVYAAPISVITLVMSSYIAESKPKTKKLVFQLSTILLLLSLPVTINSCLNWYYEVYAVKSFSVKLIEVNFLRDSKSFIHLKLNLYTQSKKGLTAFFTRYYVYKGSKLIRFVADNYPSGLKIFQDGVNLTKAIELPGDTTFECFLENTCRIHLQVMVGTRFGLTPIDFVLRM
ncbi:MAG: hypothetical protein QW731_05185, partial [Thermofilaceae archaeon]